MRMMMVVEMKSAVRFRGDSRKRQSEPSEEVVHAPVSGNEVMCALVSLHQQIVKRYEADQEGHSGSEPPAMKVDCQRGSANPEQKVEQNSRDGAIGLRAQMLGERFNQRIWRHSHFVHVRPRSNISILIIALLFSYEPETRGKAPQRASPRRRGPRESWQFSPRACGQKTTGTRLFFR